MTLELTRMTQPTVPEALQSRRPWAARRVVPAAASPVMLVRADSPPPITATARDPGNRTARARPAADARASIATRDADARVPNRGSRCFHRRLPFGGSTAAILRCHRLTARRHERHSKVGVPSAAPPNYVVRSAADHASISRRCGHWPLGRCWPDRKMLANRSTRSSPSVPIQRCRPPEVDRWSLTVRLPSASCR